MCLLPNSSWFSSTLVNTVWGTALAASFAALTLFNWSLRGSALSTVPVAASLVVYSAFLPRIAKSPRFIPQIDIEDAIAPLSFRVVMVLMVVLCARTMSFGFPQNNVMSTSSLGMAKALAWFYTARTAEYSSWSTATVIGTFGITSTRNPFAQPSGTQAISHVISSFLSLGQVIGILPKQAKARSALWTFCLVPLIPYLLNTVAIRIASAPSFHTLEHPVEALIHSASRDFEDMLQKQSKSYPAAYDEYQRRYGIQPPSGFGGWYEFAVSRNSTLIDEFDVIYDTVSPFWRISGREVLETISHVRNAPNMDLWHCEYSGAAAKTRCSHPYRTFDRHIELLFNNLLDGLPGILPDVQFLVNHIDEPRVLVPPSSSTRDTESQKTRRFNTINMSNRPTWKAITRFCATQPRSRSKAKHLVETFGLPFVTDISSAMDLCQHPEYSAMHGLFMSPMSFRLIEGLVPILSTGSPSTMGDILFPSPAYIEAEFQYDDAHDIDWDQKRNNMYWAGSTTGGFGREDQWQYYHRQRFVKLAQNLGRQRHHYLREEEGVVEHVESSFLNSRLFDVAFTRIFQCQRKSCRDQDAYFNTKTWADKDQALRSRLVFDIDGNGISGRYYKLLASRSLPIKQTIFREWHNDRLAPWVHYIPASQGMEEIPELISYLTSTESGKQQAKEIAERGRRAGKTTGPEETSKLIISEAATAKGNRDKN
ncbi:hypothetical protein AK830_g3823 [Neonectria ditissima]|uniref:Glycosyl transferase CAP10 domain-containing protein n=1 Tax=Neonectria ditissima TaxID=78410 RepID=A0A0P7BAU5_9HYPO|nr:hypothetical protein AK830_g3823 [Neonectria ditissima]